MDPGHVMTARGNLLDMAALRLKSKKPLTPSNVDQKDKVTKRVIPPKQLNVRGFMPSMEGVAKPDFSPIEIDEVVEPTGPSLADLTGVTVDNPRHLREKPESAVDTANETLRDIMDGLDEYKGRDDKRRTKK